MHKSSQMAENILKMVLFIQNIEHIKKKKLEIKNRFLQTFSKLQPPWCKWPSPNSFSNTTTTSY
jgi:hypothetical protein